MMSVEKLRDRVARLRRGDPASLPDRLCDAMMGMAEPDRRLLALAVSAILELDDRLNHFSKLREEAIAHPVVNWPETWTASRTARMPVTTLENDSTASPTSGSICENGAPEKLARGIYDRLRNGRSGLIWAVHWPDLPPEISRRWVEAAAGAMAEQEKKS